uniref:Peptidase S28 domain containing protein n=1 Tax=Haemonchus contortus TaxID=6289 RepID=W6NAG8_HAECO
MKDDRWTFRLTNWIPLDHKSRIERQNKDPLIGPLDGNGYPFVSGSERTTDMAGEFVDADASPWRFHDPHEGIQSYGGFRGREAYFKQKLDHFQGNKEWSQRYFYNNRYYRQGGNVAFLMLGGTGVLDIGWVTNEKIPFVQLAKEKGALMFALEHRFYGKSRPTE